MRLGASGNQVLNNQSGKVNMRQRHTQLLVMSALFAISSATAIQAGEPDRSVMPAASNAQVPTLQRIRDFNPWLSADNPLELSLKLHSLLRDEYTFFRGTADLFYDWCREYCTDWKTAPNEGLLLHGDIHLGNIGTYRAAGGFCFGVVDLDESFLGPFQFDLLRALMSLRLAASDNRVDLSQTDRANLQDRFLTAYRDGLTGTLTAEDLAQRHPLVKALLKTARAGDPVKLAGKFCTGNPPTKFRSTRLKKGRISDIMMPVDDQTRQSVANAVIAFASKNTERFSTAGRTGPFDIKDILDVVQWSRVDSGGSQGVRKYLVLLAPGKGPAEAPLILQLKEEPLPAAARAGLISSPASGERAAQVATASLLLNDPPALLIGHAELDKRGFLIKTKDPFSEEPDAGDFKTVEAILEAAALLGGTLGQAHRAGLRSHPNFKDQISLLSDKTRTYARSLTERTDAALAHLHRAFVNLQQDAAARSMVDQAKRRIESAKRASR